MDERMNRARKSVEGGGQAQTEDARAKKKRDELFFLRELCVQFFFHFFLFIKPV